MRPRHALIGVVVASLAAVLSGCAQIPTSGPIEQGASVPAQGGPQFIRVIANPPRDGMTPEEIVRGFQEATAAQDTGFKVARQYLTALAGTTWDPTGGVRIYDNSGLTLERTSAQVAASGTLTGELDGAGQYTVAAPGARLEVAYGLARVDGEWRIASLPDGLVLGRGDIDRGYRSFNLYYFTRDFTGLVPAPVTIPLSDRGMATTLVSSLLAGPTSWIAPAVRSGLPEGTRLALDSVPVNDGIADIALTTEVLAADDAARQALSAQIVWTLRQLPDVSGVRITVNGAPLLVPGAGIVQSMTSWPSYDPDAVADAVRAFALDSRGLLEVTPEQRLALLAKLEPAIRLPGVSLDSTRVAGLSADRRTVWEYTLAGATPGVQRYAGNELSRPSWDRSGAFWVVDRGVGLVLVQGTTATRIPVSGLPESVTDKDLVAAAVSRDGTRIALLVQRGTKIEPMLARIERGTDRVRVAAPRRIDAAVTDAVDLAWADSGTLAVLGSSGTSGLEVVEMLVGTATVRRQSAPEGSVAIAATAGRPMLVGTNGTATQATPRLFMSAGTEWTPIGVAASDPVYPG